MPNENVADPLLKAATYKAGLALVSCCFERRTTNVTIPSGFYLFHPGLNFPAKESQETKCSDLHAHTYRSCFVLLERTPTKDFLQVKGQAEHPIEFKKRDSTGHLGCVYRCLLDFPPAHAKAYVFEPPRRAHSFSFLLDALPPKGPTGDAHVLGAAKVASMERYSAATGQIVTPFQRYDLLLLVSLVFSEGIIKKNVRIVTLETVKEEDFQLLYSTIPTLRFASFVTKAMQARTENRHM